MGERANHDSHGLGRVVQVAGDKVFVDFGDRAGHRPIAAASAKLAKL